MNELKPDCKLRRFPRSMSLHLSFETQISEFYFLQNRYKIFIDHFCLHAHSKRYFHLKFWKRAVTKSLILDMDRKFQKYLSDNSFVLKGQRLLLAFSGGVDSCVLLDLCLKSGLMPALAHCNFQLRGHASKEDADWIKNLALKKVWNVIFKALIPKLMHLKKVSIQMAARQLRYRWFDTLSNQYDYDLILVAHHADDALKPL